MGKEEPSGEKKRGFLIRFRISFNSLDGPARDLVVALVLILVGKEPPVHEAVWLRGLNKFLRGEGLARCSGANFIPLCVRSFDRAPRAAMINLSCHGGVVIPMTIKILGKGFRLGEFRKFTKPWSETINSGRTWAQSGHYTGPRGVT